MKKFEPEVELSKSLNEEQKQNLHKEYIENKSVLGIDIYKYSEYSEDIQVYVPVLFNSLYKITVENCSIGEKYFFQNYGSTFSDFKENFISTGDGGFQIFDNPLQSLIFAIYFQLNVKRFNSGSLTGKLNINLFDIIGRIELRYATTYDKIYCYDKNFFGAAIINNSRILSKDNLNRLLTDYKSLQWFDQTINTIENLMIMKIENFYKISYFKEFSKDHGSLLFGNPNSDKFKSFDILKIGTIISKNTSLDIYNLKIQVLISIKGEHKDFKGFFITVGNLNTQGIQ
ncbi:hypothetical protein AM493_13160 [Flavobacterium akiainvivens]|uniref:Uncharacterized protein n=1 Tax=Flavobacterium akiainvivens TaxID=1202724 RepID=A0A0N0RQU4_9FLAO|nr:hypothetical protein [Flavobacterium akiainvivens]KOS06872.1 hypothetical protein AM493_13160 [Flavobacterium akiainvivens]SFQ69349.1 hypothetical protein SAMN05444144_11525 [Flavobacterium akiainvivens]